MSEHFFITGGTGFIGASLLPRLLRAYPGSTATLLVRSANDEEAARRVHAVAVNLVDTWGIGDAHRRIESVRGDVAIELCGLGEECLNALSERTTHIVHGAAAIRFDQPLDDARRVNCAGTGTLLEIAERFARRGRLERFIYIGTSSVSGRREGTIYEHELEMGQEFFNTYEQSKCEAEGMVHRRFNALPCTVFRPSIVIGDSKTGWTSSFNVVYIPLRLLHAGLLSEVPASPDVTLDLVPVDWVCEAMVRIMQSGKGIGTTYHLTAGPGRAAPLGEVVRLAIDYFDMHAPLPHPRSVAFITPAEYRSRRSAFQGGPRALEAQLEALFPYVSVDRRFDSANTDAALEGSTIVFPRFSSCAEAILGYCLRSRWGKSNYKL